MTEQNSNELLLDVFIFETTQNINQLEELILKNEEYGCYTTDSINEIFRIMHTVKGSSAMMQFNNISTLAHSAEDLFFFLRENKPQNTDCTALCDLILDSVDFIKVELQKIINGDPADGDASGLISNNKDFLTQLKQQNTPPDNPAKKVDYETPVPEYNHTYKATIFFEDGCEMENIRAQMLLQDMENFSKELLYVPEGLFDNSETAVRHIREKGFTVYVKTDSSYEEVYNCLIQTILLKQLDLILLEDDLEYRQTLLACTQMLSGDSSSTDQIEKTDSRNDLPEQSKCETIFNKPAENQPAIQSIISVNVIKLDKLMDLMGEMVIAEEMVMQNPDLAGLDLESFHTAARQLHKITSEMQDMVMSIRMIPLASTFQKMHRIVRDMCKNLGKEAKLKLIGEETEVDKNIIEHISDPLMHLVRNSIDHGLESSEERGILGKPLLGEVTLEAKNAGSDVLIIVKDDGRGLNKQKIIQRAQENGLFTKNEEELTDKEIYNLIFLPGFSTKEAVSEYSGRGVGMDVVVKNIEAVGGSVSIDSVEGAGSVITLKIPLTLAIIDGMNVRVGNSSYTIPTMSIKESFRPNLTDLITDPDGNEMIFVRGQCYSILRLHKYFNVKTDVTAFNEGILIMVEQEEKTICIFVDRLIGQQQVVVKTLPQYIRNFKRITGISGCTLLGDGSISLILDITKLIELGS